MKNLANLLPKNMKILKLEKAKYNPNEIIEVQDDYRQIHGLPPERITRREYDKRIEKEDRKYHNWLIRFLKEKQRQEEWDRKHPSRIRFGYAPAYN